MIKNIKFGKKYLCSLACQKSDENHDGSPLKNGSIAFGTTNHPSLKGTFTLKNEIYNKACSEIASTEKKIMEFFNLIFF